MSSSSSPPPVPPAPAERSADGAFQLMRSLMSLSREALEHAALTRHLVLRQLRSYAARLGLPLDALSVLHVAGTKGKGSTCAMAESVLRAHGFRTGLFTSPHLVSLRERFRVAGRPVREDVFYEHLYGTYEDLRATVHLRGEHPPMPSYFRFLTLVAFRIFAAEGVDVVVLETGMGGRLDATNVVPRPVACGISLIDLDHVAVLGGTLDLIAREKGGILKRGVPAWTVPQRPEAAKALDECAREAGTELVLAPPLPGGGDPPLGLEGEHQYSNAALAVALAHAWLRHAAETGLGGAADAGARLAAPLALARAVPRELDPAALPELFRRGLAACRWPGRCQRVPSPRVPGLTWFLDGAHTPESTERCLEWFGRATAGEGDALRVLVFNCGHERDPFQLLGPLASARLFHAVVCCPFDFDRPRRDGPPALSALARADDAPECLAGAQLPPDCDSWQGTLLQVWELMERQAGGPPDGTTGGPCAGGRRTVMPSSESAVLAVRDLAAAAGPRTRVDVLVTGSLYTVGNVLSVLDPELLA